MVTKNTLKVIFSRGKLRNYKAKQTIIYPHKSPRSLFFIKSGYVKLCSMTKHDEDKLYGIYKPGEIFPLPWVSGIVSKRLYYESMTTVSLLQISLIDFKKFLRSNPHLVFEILSRLSETSNFFVDRLDNLEIKMSYPRVIRRLIFLAERLGTSNGNKLIIPIPLTHKDIADSVAVVRETVSRLLKKLEKKGLIQFRKHLIELVDLQKLKKELSSYYLIHNS